MNDQLPLIGPMKEECACGCGTFGTVRTKVMLDGLKHVKGCPCKRCQGSRHKRSSGTRERRLARKLGGERSPLSGALNGYDIRIPLRNGDWLFIEETIQVAFWRGFLSWWLGKGTQTKLARLLALRGVRAVRGPTHTILPNEDADILIALARDE